MIRRNAFEIGLAVAGVVLLALLAVVGVAAVRSTERTVTLTVTRLDDQSTYNGNGSRSHKYLVFTDHGVYQDVDSLAYLKFNSSDLFGQLQERHTYSCRATGWRIPVLSTYRNLIDCHEVG